MAEAGPTECENQKNIISNALKKPLRAGETWYLVDSKWFKQWKKYVGYDSWDTSLIGDKSANPAFIDNCPLFKENSPGVLKDNLIDELEYMLLPEEGWEKLVEWYGLDGQEPICRKVIEQGMFVKHSKVEVYLMDLKLCHNDKPDNITVEQFSKADTIEHIEKKMRLLFDINEDRDVRLWNKYMSNTYEPLNKLDNSVQEAGLYQGQVIVIEEKNEDGTWPRDANKQASSNNFSNQTSNNASSSTTRDSPSSSYTSTSRNYSYNYGSSGSGYGSSSYYGSSYDGVKGHSTPGLCGLGNLGNTCFMNSAIQCMSNVPELTDYFLSTDWKSELNVDNPLGMKGEIATSYAELVRNMWSGDFSYTVPRNFKVSVGHFAPQFSGYQQQDSQELMAFLLDGLHEDLNRIKKKPYIEQKDEDDRPDEVVAKEAWENYLKRNDSIIVDIFHGLLKSTLVCPECQKISVTFDPFCYLSLPLPDKKERQIEVFFVALDSAKKPKHYKLTVPQRGSVSDLCQALSKLTKVEANKLVVTDVYNRRFHKVFSPEESLTHILDRDDIFIYEVPVVEADHPDTAIVPVYMREKKVRTGYNGYQHVSQQLFGQPLLVAVPRDGCTHEVFYNCVLNRMSRYVHLPDDNDEWWKTPKKSWSEPPDRQISNGVSEVEMNDDESSTNGKSSISTSSSSSSSAERMDNGEEDENNDEQESGNQSSGEQDDTGTSTKPPKLFTFQIVNSFGTTEMETLKDDGKPLQFSSRTYVAIDWHPKAKAKFYDEKAAEELEVDESVNAKLIQKKNSLQLTECLEMFCTAEKLGEQDPWYCPSCKKHQQATKKFDLWVLPQVLVIHLKRFSYNRYWRDKLDLFVEYPTTGLNMKKWILNKTAGPANYDLVAVCNHYGGMGGGHYTAYGKNKETDSWHYFDDSNVSSATEEAAVTKAGYVLVYRLRDPASTTSSTSISTVAASSNKASSASPGAAGRSSGTSSSSSTTTSSSSFPATVVNHTAVSNGSQDNSSDDEMDIN